MNAKEFGGYFSLEIASGEEYYSTCREYEVRRYNSGRNAIVQAVNDCDARCVWLPVYLCGTVADALEGREIRYYSIDREFMPVNLEAEENDIVLWVNYFGIQNAEKIRQAVSCRLIIDNTQAFYSKPVNGAYNVYSCRKFFGVPDGSYLICSKFAKPEEVLPEGSSYGTALYLLKALDTSTNEAYADSLLNEERITAEGVCTMSRLTRAILESIGYEEQKRIRKENYGEMCRLLGGINEINTPPPNRNNDVYFAPMVYPLLVRSEGLRKHLVKNSIYVPQWWKSVIDDVQASEWEKYLSEYLLPLPVDHRYSREDMNYIAQTITEYLNSNL